jgi:plasmid stabilization system protein ParE
MNFVVEFTGRAKQDLRVIRDWLSARSRDGALRWLDALDAAYRELTTSASKAMVAPEADDLGFDLRQKLFKTRRGRFYRMLFVIRDQTVFIVEIRGPGQDLVQPEDLELP